MTTALPLRPLLALALALPAAAAGAQQPSVLPRLAAVHAATTPAEALARAERLAAEPGAGELGLDYLRGDLLEALGRPDQAARAFAAAMRQAPLLAAHARYRLARLELARHPEIAAGLVAPLVSAASPPELRHRAAGLLRQALAAGGDCRLLDGIEWNALLATDRRSLQVRQADCSRSAAPQQAAAQLTALLAYPGDEAAR